MSPHLTPPLAPHACPSPPQATPLPYPSNPHNPPSHLTPLLRHLVLALFRQLPMPSSNAPPPPSPSTPSPDAPSGTSCLPFAACSPWPLQLRRPPPPPPPAARSAMDTARATLQNQPAATSSTQGSARYQLRDCGGVWKGGGRCVEGDIHRHLLVKEKGRGACTSLATQLHEDTTSPATSSHSLHLAGASAASRLSDSCQPPTPLPLPSPVLFPLCLPCSPRPGPPLPPVP